MKVRPILFSGHMVRAILEGRKTMTRRVVADHPEDALRLRLTDHAVPWLESYIDITDEWVPVVGRHGCETPVRCPYGVVGDRLWVRETAWYDREPLSSNNETRTRCFFAGSLIVKRDDGYAGESPYTPTIETLSLNTSLVRRPSIYMPRWASRITLEITDVRVERLQEITEEDAIAEGVQFMPSMPAALTNRTSFGKGWDKLNAKRGYSWESNPWVWCLSFKKGEC